MNIFKKFRLAKSPVFELNPNRKYLVGLDNNMFTVNDAVNLNKHLAKMGIKNLVAMFNGDPNQGVKIIKQRNYAPTRKSRVE